MAWGLFSRTNVNSCIIWLNLWLSPAYIWNHYKGGKTLNKCHFCFFHLRKKPSRKERASLYVMSICRECYKIYWGDHRVCFLYKVMEKSQLTFWPVHHFLRICVFCTGYLNKGFPGCSAGKESACNCGRPGFDPWVGKIPWRRERLPNPVFRPGEFPGLNSPMG